jgi:hypothetical protein
MARRRSTNCDHPHNWEDEVTNEQLCTTCGYLRDLMPLEEWDRLKITDPNGDEAEPRDEEVAA